MMDQHPTRTQLDRQSLVIGITYIEAAGQTRTGTQDPCSNFDTQIVHAALIYICLKGVFKAGEVLESVESWFVFCLRVFSVKLDPGQH
jgi:hypothetical protein